MMTKTKTKTKTNTISKKTLIYEVSLAEKANILTIYNLSVR